MRKIFKTILSALGAAFCLTGCGPSAVQLPPPEVFDATKLPFYREDIENMQYSYTDDERIRPFWMGNVMVNEQLMITEKDGKIEGNLLYDAIKVLSVRDAKLEIEYVQDVDYTISGHTVTLPQGSAIPIFRDKWSRGEDVPSAYPQGDAGTGYQMIGDTIYTESSLVWGNYIHVTYVYDPSQADRKTVKSYKGELVGLNDLLADKKEINMTVFGDSISEGHSSSGLWKHPPHCPPYAELVRYGIQSLGGVKVNYSNISLGGKDSDWAAEDTQLERLQLLKPDLLLLAFGTNDKADRIENGAYERNIRSVIQAAKMANKNCQIVLVSPFPSREESKSADLHQKISDTLHAIVASEDYFDIMTVDMYEFCKPILNIKNYYEIAGNNQNHPNDFIHRCYAMNILSGIFDFTAM